MPPHQQGGGGSPGFDPRTGPRPQQEGRPGNASSSRTFQWISAADGFIPANAVQGGVEKDGTPLFVARAMHKGGLHPGKAGKHIQNGGCAIGYDHKELTLREYQVLCGDASQLRWINQDGGLLIQGFKPVDAGHEASGEPLYIAKTLVDGSQQLGKCAPHIKGIAYPYGHKEKNGSQYMVLAYIN
ncbi:hypothetical protein GGI04_004214 [Coemansia thaxteri]|uniref:Uncharacterized protein n=1 Tax=Coemansia thaxteri TaxID=2663907 RepID=A0A9W8BDX8_9FUNG|nr:hypothetical protein GGI04_004214 [Coemansia thaxteri]KAJ2003648.1 hypothetical protein H4R26_002959 [Coemansia thaxteri]KAJ2473349.1 hypothetical protein GGI02_000932 [Coemansia sp. RSA 2322]